MEVVASLSQGRTAAAQCGLFTHKSVSDIFEPPCTITIFSGDNKLRNAISLYYYSLSPLSRVFTIIQLKQTIFLGYIMLQLYCVHNLRYRG